MWNFERQRILSLSLSLFIEIGQILEIVCSRGVDDVCTKGGGGRFGVFDVES